MSTNLPVIGVESRCLAGVLTSAFASVRDETNDLGLTRSRRTVVILADGLGAENLAARKAHARTITKLSSVTVPSGFPTTTASALTALMTGVDPGQSGMVGYAIRDPQTGTVVNQLSGLDHIDVKAWQSKPTVWELNSDVSSVVISAERYRSSGLTRAILRGAPYEAANTHAERVEQIRRFLATHDHGVAYVYVPELDMAAHAHGVASDKWVSALELFDGFIADVLRVLGPRDGLIITADHGIVDVPSHKHRLIPTDSPLLDRVVTGGEPRFLHLYSDRDADELAKAWRDVEGERAYVATRTEAIAAGWFGVVDAAVLDRIGNVLVTPRGVAVYYDERTATPQSMSMVGQHGGLSRAETHVPVIRGGVFA